MGIKNFPLDFFFYCDIIIFLQRREKWKQVSIAKKF